MAFTIPISQKYLRTIAIVGIALAFFLLTNTVYAIEVVQSPEASADDAYENDAGVGFNSSANVIWVESGGTAAGRRNSAVRFPSMAIPNGAAITSAVLSLMTDSTGSQRMNGSVYAHDVDNSPSLSDVTTLTRTTAVTFWQSGNISSNARHTHGVTAQVAEVIARESWASGNAITIILIGIDGSNYNAFLHSWDSGVPAQYPILTVNFTVDPPTTTTEAVSGINPTTATGNGTTTSLVGVDGDERGFVWGTTSLGDPGDVAPGSTSYDDFVSESGTFIEESFTGDIDSLAETTTFYVRAFTHTAEGGYGYGNEVSFASTTTPSGLSVIMPQFIILGVIVWVVLLLFLQVRWGIMKNPAAILITGTLGLIVIAALIAIAG